MLAAVRLGLISDQHGNDVAFRAVIDDIERVGVDEIVCLGDAVQGGGEPVETLDRLKALNCAVVLGNADDFLLEIPTDSPEPINERMLEVREWTLSLLDETHLDFIRSFKTSITRKLGELSMLFFHGSPKSYDDVLIPDLAEASLEPYKGHDVGLLAGGHTHTQWTRCIDRALFVNPGSVGLAYDHRSIDAEFKIRPIAEYALVVLDDLGLAVEFRHVTYSPEAVQVAAVANGRPYAQEWAGQWRRASRSSWAS